MMKTISSISYLLMVGFMMIVSSCSSNEEHYPEPADKGDAIKFEIGILSNVAARSGMQLRSVTSADFNTTFSVGDEIGVFVAVRKSDQPTNLDRQSLHVTNQKLTLDANGNWEADSPIYFSSDAGMVHDFYAYYPYDPTATDPLNMTHEAQKNQNTDANYSKSDLLVSKKHDVKKTATVALNFSHFMSLVQVEVLDGGLGARMDDSVVVAMHNVKQKITGLNLSTYRSVLGGSTDSIVMKRVTDAPGYVYRALIPEQKLDAEKRIFSFTRGNTVSYISSSSAQTTSGQVSQYNIQLKSATVDPNHVYSFGDVYPHIGLAEGIVFETSNGGKNGMVISLDEGFEMWSTENQKITGLYKVSGFNNTSVIKAIDPSLSAYPAFKWCANKGEEWYLPIMDELLIFINNSRFRYGYESMNEKITNTGGTEFDFTNYGYWLSVDAFYNLAFLQTESGVSHSFYKNYSAKVRAMRTF